ncbi:MULTISPECIES: hypothetical protein [Pseudoxanthomonas]|nr:MULTISPECIES: hypothetical protein [Pseudoxanthomonas]
MRLKKNIGKTRFFFLATARGAFADDHATIACHLSGRAPTA